MLTFYRNLAFGFSMTIRMKLSRKRNRARKTKYKAVGIRESKLGQEQKRYHWRKAANPKGNLNVFQCPFGVDREPHTSEKKSFEIQRSLR